MDGTDGGLRPLALPERFGEVGPGPSSPPAWGVYAMVPVGCLAVDPAWQRPVSAAGWRLVRQIAAEFDAGAFGALLGRWEGARFAIVDGQHRALAALALGLGVVPCLALGAGEGAAAFVRVNRARLALTPAQVFHAEAVAGAPEAAALEALLADVGLAVPRFPVAGGLRRGEVVCVGYLRRMVREGQTGLLRVALEVLVEAEALAGPVDKVESSGMCMQGGVKAAVTLVEALMAAGLPDLAGELDRLAATIAEASPRDLWDEARAASATAGGPAWAHCARLIAREHAQRGGAEVGIGA